MEPKGPIVLLGVGGIGMSALAHLALDRGLEVFGFDDKSSATIKDLTARGLKLISSKNDFPDDALFIRSTAFPTSHPILSDTDKQQIKHRSDFLGLLMEGSKQILVTGTHGKTTTSAVIYHMLHTLGLEPSGAIGGKLETKGRGGFSGRGDWFVAEADESDGSFLNYQPFFGVITSIGDDHLDHYQSSNEIDQAFERFSKQVHPEGRVILCWDDPRVRALSDSIPMEQRFSYGFSLGADVRLYRYETRGGFSHVDILVERDRYQASLPMPGRHNALNFLAAISLARVMELNIESVLNALGSFPGVGRRMTRVFSGRSIQMYDDYAHNPEKVSSCIRALRDSYPDHHIHILFQPHRFSRTISLFDAFTKSFGQANQVTLFPVYSAGEAKPDGFSLNDLRSSIESVSDCPCHLFESWDAIFKALVTNDSKPRIIVTMGAGDISEQGFVLRDMLATNELNSTRGH